MSLRRARARLCQARLPSQQVSRQASHPGRAHLPAAHPLLIFSNSSTHFNPNYTQRQKSKGYFYAHQETCLWRGEQRQLLLRKMLQQEPSLLLDTRADTEQQNFVGNLASLGRLLAALLGLFCSGREMLVGREKMLCKS